MNAPRFLRAVLAVVPALGFASCDRQAGTSDEHETTVAARLFQPDGSPASGARVRIYAVDDTSKSPREQVFASSDGSVVLPGLPAGEYNLVATDDAGHGIVIDSLLSTGAGVPQLRSDTLRPMGAITGRLQVEPQHSPRIAWVQIMGIGLATNVDTSGRFRLEVPVGRITLAALTRDEDYTPTFRAIRTISDSVLDLGVVRLEYTGIPVVEGLTVTYDTLDGVATVRWNRATMPGLRGYELQRSGFVSVSIDDLSDTVFHDTLYRPEGYDDKSTTREYAVVAVDSARNPGVAWRRVPLTAPSPWMVPRRGFRIDSTIRVEVPENACDVMDTAAGSLVCIRERSGNTDMWWMHRADTVEVRVSRDGIHWTLLPIPATSLRTVVWKDRIWVVRGLGNGAEGTYPQPTYLDSTRVARIPLYDGVRIETWTTNGSLERVDTILDRKDATLYRLVVVSDTLLLLRDSAAYRTSLMFSGYHGFTLGLRRLAEPGSDWSEEAPGMGDSLPEWTTWERAIWLTQPLGLLLAQASWSGGEWSRYAFTGLFVTQSGERFPWKVGSGPFNTVHRGNGVTVPPFVIWKGCALVHDPAAGKIQGICPEE